MSSNEGGDNLTTLGNTAYSFYLNVIVLNHVQPAASSSQSESQSQPESPSKEGAAENSEEKKVETVANGASTTQESDGSALTKIKTLRAAAAAAALSPMMDKSIHSTMKAMSGASLAVSKRSIAVSNKASAYLASKTMVTRASMALTKSLPMVIKSMGELDLTIGSRFSQGNLTVLQVDLKATALPRYIEVVRGKEVAEQFLTAQSALNAIGATETMGSLEKEMLPQVRQGLMGALSDRLIKTMKDIESGLEVECIALEESEESRWLFTFMEFQSQMK